MNKIKFLLFSTASLLLFATCKKDTIIEDPKPQPLDTTSLAVNFTAVANNKIVQPITGSYTNTSEDNFTITKFNYYISNVKLKRDDGFVFTEPESYHIIKHVEDLTSFEIHQLPGGNYTSVEFLIGVDSLRNISGAQTGALDVKHQMFWEWESGYIFFKLEGKYVSQEVPSDGEYAIHIGGFKGKYNCLQKCSFSLSQPIVAKLGTVSRLYYDTHVDEIFKNPKPIGFDYYYSSISDAMFKAISDNYKDMFVVAKVEN